MSFIVSKVILYLEAISKIPFQIIAVDRFSLLDTRPCGSLLEVTPAPLSLRLLVFEIASNKKRTCDS
jgi:hypothetical protein